MTKKLNPNTKLLLNNANPALTGNLALIQRLALPQTHSARRSV
jgi:hypothetical protein